MGAPDDAVASLSRLSFITTFRREGRASRFEGLPDTKSSQAEMSWPLKFIFSFQILPPATFIGPLICTWEVPSRCHWRTEDVAVVFSNLPRGFSSESAARSESTAPLRMTRYRILTPLAEPGPKSRSPYFSTTRVSFTSRSFSALKPYLVLYMFTRAFLSEGIRDKMYPS